VIDISNLQLDRRGAVELVKNLSGRGIRILGLAGADPAWSSDDLPPILHQRGPRMSKDLAPPVGVSAAAVEAGNIPQIGISAADRPPDGGRREEPQAGPGTATARKRFLSRAGRIGAAIIAFSLAGLAGWGLYGLVAPRYAGWSHFIAAKLAQMSAPPVDLVPVTQKIEGEIQGLQAKVAALEKARNATANSLSSLEELSRRIDDAKSETKAEVGALSSRVLQFQQETNTKFAEMTAASPAKKPRAEPVESKAAPAVEKSPKRAHSWRNDTFDPSQHPYSLHEETKPRVGSGLAFDRSQIRYCLSENIRMDAWEGQVNQYSDTSVDAFNAAVNDYNARCSHIRYRREDLESVRSEVDANRVALTRQGLAKAAGNP